jgi:hypothetical protein
MIQKKYEEETQSHQLTNEASCRQIASTVGESKKNKNGGKEKE